MNDIKRYITYVQYDLSFVDPIQVRDCLRLFSTGGRVNHHSVVPTQNNVFENIYGLTQYKVVFRQTTVDSKSNQNKVTWGTFSQS